MRASGRSVWGPRIGSRGKLRTVAVGLPRVSIWEDSPRVAAASDKYIHVGTSMTASASTAALVPNAGCAIPGALGAEQLDTPAQGICQPDGLQFFRVLQQPNFHPFTFFPGKSPLNISIDHVSIGSEYSQCLNLPVNGNSPSILYFLP